MAPGQPSYMPKCFNSKEGVGVLGKGSANHGHKEQRVWTRQGGKQVLSVVLINTGSLLHRCSVTICSVIEWIDTHFPFFSVHPTNWQLHLSSSTPLSLFFQRSQLTFQWNNPMDMFQSFTSWTLEDLPKYLQLISCSSTSNFFVTLGSPSFVPSFCISSQVLHTLSFSSCVFQSSFQGAHLFSQHSLQWAHNSLRIKVLDYRPTHTHTTEYQNSQVQTWL